MTQIQIEKQKSKLVEKIHHLYYLLPKKDIL